jgi:hypothetical protein
MGGDSVADGVVVGGFGDGTGADGCTHGALEVGVVGMLAADDARSGIEAQFGGGEDVLPAPFIASVGTCAFACAGEIGGSAAGIEVGCVKLLDMVQIFL